MVLQGEISIPQEVSEQKFTNEEVELLLTEFNRKGIFGTLRAEQQESHTFFDPKQGYIAEDDESSVEAVLDMYREALLEENPVATRYYSSEEDRKKIIDALESGSRKRKVLLAYYQISEETPWAEASDIICSRQIHKSEDFPRHGTVSGILEKLEKPSIEEKKKVEEEEKEYYASIPTVYERLRPPLSRGVKLLLGVPQEHLTKLEELLRTRHKLLHPDAPFVVVDVAKIIEESGIDPKNFHRDLIYQEALKQLDPEFAEKTHDDSLQEFKDKADEFRQKIKEEDLEGRDQRFGLFIKNLDAATAGIPRDQVGNLIFTTFRIGWEFNIYGHVSSQETIDLSAGAGEALNDAEIIWEHRPLRALDILKAKPKTEHPLPPMIIEVGVGMSAFQEGLAGWRTNADGEDYCPPCWGKWLSQFTAEKMVLTKEEVKEDANPTAKNAYYRRGVEKWSAQCETCGQIVSASYTEKEVEEAKSFREERRARVKKRYG